MKKLYWILILVVLVIGGFFWMNSGSSSNFQLVSAEEAPVIYKSSTCGCCGLYGDYFERKGNSGVEIKSIQDLEIIKNQYGIPPAMESCHTTIIGDYFVEGHVPLEGPSRTLPECAGR